MNQDTWSSATATSITTSWSGPSGRNYGYLTHSLHSTTPGSLHRHCGDNTDWKPDSWNTILVTQKSVQDIRKHEQKAEEQVKDWVRHLHRWFTAWKSTKLILGYLESTVTNRRTSQEYTPCKASVCGCHPQKRNKAALLQEVKIAFCPRNQETQVILTRGLGLWALSNNLGLAPPQTRTPGDWENTVLSTVTPLSSGKFTPSR